MMLSGKYMNRGIVVLAGIFLLLVVPVIPHAESAAGRVLDLEKMKPRGRWVGS